MDDEEASDRARDRWPLDGALALLVLCVGMILGITLVLLLPSRLKCRMRCAGRAAPPAP